MRSVLIKGLAGALAVLLTVSIPSLGGVFAYVGTDDDKAELSRELTTLFRSARGVISKNQKHINNPDIGDKGLSSEKVVAAARQNYENATGKALVLPDVSTPTGEAVHAMLAAISEVMAEAQPLINEQGKGFKGFLPAIFARLVAAKFSNKMEGKISIKLTAPKSYVRNRKNRPDKWESGIIEDQFKSDGYEKGKAFWENTSRRGQDVYRYILPEYYAKSCLGCHGMPKGERDITGGKKEGGQLGELGGAISLVISN